MANWEKRPILKSGRIVVELLKLPEKRSKSKAEPERLVLHIRREDSFRGLLIQSKEELDDLLAAAQSEKLAEIASALTELYKRRRVQEFEL